MILLLCSGQSGANTSSKKCGKICETLKIDVLKVDDQESYAEEWLPSFIEGLK